MNIGIKNINKSDEKNYSNMTNEEKINFKRRIILDGINFSQNFSYSNFAYYENLSSVYAGCLEELNNIEVMVKDINLDIKKKKELLELARQEIPLFYFPLNNMYSESELRYFENCILPYVNKQKEINEIKKLLFNSYQNYVIYNDIYELWTEELDTLHKFIIFETFRNKNKHLTNKTQSDKKEQVHLNKIEKIKRRIKMHISKDNNVVLNEENTNVNMNRNEKIKCPPINFDDWI
ncbi:hypothetical protein C923_05519 [Plasmodium falciparum UGT5.1]|uniref:Uncharacterized protein n=7 Tax=Plasmodium falciparum TaxID=5833 RepID=Q8IL61_PLAF7|nr:conserved Plasmodium protein, unknown function [Plasmodium falciparum 3D7]ETW16047.1 hypothetical protein PFFVO_05032 [Plasmodium falciparum Vietnam Oak-Knoll (FVO)]ETW33924.1 hypothetical protein PFTANZ_05378 [Plasmodium falciparum Tanzania (2000708)]ETW54056.1 hypothetical protein PFUGPA_03928 [Plasmodium falciparum Palo Alto/Uganda]ETW58364.1 hypothetical protein PFMC_05467 [Plasmodium falciparum CAMP/Malaysia]EWC73775.1 hypothetical protein C923_05519 [Plasmodium falciparum UGT5.1]KAF4|eukprot:XP_001348562.1 conserved Plasmodium protein, unknown function [Plasmodium falciparum 3D7]